MTSDTDGVRKFLARFCEAWAEHDGTAIGGHFTEDGSLINPFGQRADGREAIAAMYGEYFAGMLSGTSTAIKVETVRSVGADHAFADTEQTITGPDGDVVLVVHLAALLSREGEVWRFVDARPYAPASPPA